MSRKVHVCDSSEHLVAEIVGLIQQALGENKANNKCLFVLGYSGGSMPKLLVPALKQAIPVDERSKVRLFPVDERLVPLDHPENNTNVYLEGLKGVFDEEQFLIPSRTGNETGDEACNSMNQQLAEWAESPHHSAPQADLVFLGMGPDGHTCSLFPNHPLLQCTDWTASIDDSPKPPPRRVTVTLSLLAHAQNLAFVATGESKAPVIKAIISDDSEQYPAGLVKLNNGRPVHFFLDKPAAAKL